MMGGCYWVRKDGWSQVEVGDSEEEAITGKIGSGKVAYPRELLLLDSAPYGDVSY
jgi:hypothetical protein